MCYRFVSGIKNSNLHEKLFNEEVLTFEKASSIFMIYEKLMNSKMMQLCFSTKKWFWLIVSLTVQVLQWTPIIIMFSEYHTTDVQQSNVCVLVCP